MVKLTSITLLLLLCTFATCRAFSTVSTLLQDNSGKISKLKEVASSYPDAPSDSIYYLRYCLSDKPEDEIVSLLKSNLDWRSNEGKDICTAAATAVEAASSSGPWDNTPVREKAPHASIVNKYITPSQCLTTTVDSGDLCYCIRAGQIDDVALMSEMSVDQMVEFFIYCKEVNSLVANMRSEQTDQLITVLAVNDLLGVKLIGGDATFRKALGAALTKATELYPNLAGPTFLLNLPKLLGGMMKLFTPFMPAEVRARLICASGPLKDVNDLVDISPSGDKAARALFLKQIDDLLKK